MLHQSSPLVSVVIPCYNQGHFLSDAIESVLNQTHRPLDIVVIDDGSTDGTSDVAARYPEVRCLRQQNMGLSEARNRGIKESLGSYLIFLDADDRLLPHAVETGLNALKTHPECAFVYGESKSIASDGTPVANTPRPRIDNEHYMELLRDNYIYNPAMVVYRREIFHCVAGFDRSVNPAADYDLYLRISRKYRIFGHGTPVCEYRQHESSMSTNSALMLKITLAVLRSQKTHLKGNKRYRQAYRAGVKHWKEFYGDRLVNDVRAHYSKHNLKPVVSGLLPLIRHYPRGFLKHSFRKLYCMLFREVDAL
jgi:glycosyltransferase involved in cell wall biosynthesis